MVKVIVGTERNQYIAQKVLEYSIKKNATVPVEISFTTQTEMRRGGTNFGFVRFHVPEMCSYRGKAIYLDADQLVFEDIKRLHDSLDDEHGVALVNSPEGYFGNKPVGQQNQTSVMVLNCESLRDWNPKVMFEPVVPNRTELKDGQIHYRDFMMLSWMDPNRIQPLDPRWNHFNIINEDTKLVHFSHVRSQPWKKPKHALAEKWGMWLREAVRDGYVKRWELVRDVLTGHVDRHFLRFIM